MNNASTRYITRIQLEFRKHVVERERLGCVLSRQSYWFNWWRTHVEVHENFAHVEEWLEKIDYKHRYGYYLRHFHSFWLTRSEDNDSFFTWLDFGQGQSVELEKCSRLALEQMQLVYCTPRSRQQYVVDQQVVESHLYVSSRWTIESQNQIDHRVFVLSPDRILYLNELQIGSFHSSSFLSGQPVLARGYMYLRNGQVERVVVLPLLNQSDSIPTLKRHWSALGVDTSTIQFTTQSLGEIQPIEHEKNRNPMCLSPRHERSTSSSEIAMFIVRVVRIQKRFRAYRVRREKNGCILSASSSFRRDAAERALKRVKKYVKRLSVGLAQSEIATMLHCESWLEAVDPKHRYGHYLRLYHAKWLNSDTFESFFDWLDHGAGSQIDLIECSRFELEKMRVVYCDKSTRRKYRVELVRKDPSDEAAAPILRYCETKLAIDTAGDSKWIFVLSLEGDLYASEKKRGRFHHSSFLSGRPTLAAGKLFATHGKLTAVEPHSGHYKPSLKNLIAMSELLQSHGLDLSSLQFIKPKKWTQDWPFDEKDIVPPPAPLHL